MIKLEDFKTIKNDMDYLLDRERWLRKILHDCFIYKSKIIKLNKDSDDILKKYNMSTNQLRVSLIDKYIRSNSNWICSNEHEIELNLYTRTNIFIKIIDDYIIEIENDNYIIKIDNKNKIINTVLKQIDMLSNIEKEILYTESLIIMDDLFKIALENEKEENEMNKVGILRDFLIKDKLATEMLQSEIKKRLIFKVGDEAKKWKIIVEGDNNSVCIRIYSHLNGELCFFLADSRNYECSSYLNFFRFISKNDFTDIIKDSGCCLLEKMNIEVKNINKRESLNFLGEEW